MDVSLFDKKCQACEGGVAPLSAQESAAMLKEVAGWEIVAGELRRAFKFKNYHEVMAFVNATAWISHRENHHPDMEVGFRQVVMRYSTHAVKGLTENDFICAAKVGRLVE